MAKKKRNDPREGFRRFLRVYRGKVVWLSVLTVLQSLLQVSMALLFRFVIDAAVDGGSRLPFWGGVLVADMLALVAVHAILAWSTGDTADKMIAKLRQGILRTAVFSRDEKLLGYHSGELLSRGMEDVYTVCEGAVSVLPTLVGQISRLGATFAAVLLISPTVAGVLMIVGIVIGGASACLRPYIRKHQRKVRQTDDEVMATMQEDLQQLELIQSLGAQEQILSRFHYRLGKSLMARFRRRILSVSSNGVINAASQIGTGVLLLWGAARVADHTLSYGSLTAMLQLLSSFRTPVLGLSALWTRFAAIEVASERLWDLLQETEPAPKLQKRPVVSEIVLEDVTFFYPGEETPVLENFNFKISLDGWTCLTGISGKGKTTIFKLILGLYAPQKGRVYLCTDQGEMSCSEATRELFAYVPQDYALFSGTIFENLQLVAPDAGLEQIRKALHIAGADFVWELSEDVNTQVRENNTGLSKGQIQRLAIARAVLMERPIFLLDECTSALDAGTEDAVLRNLSEYGKQAVLVTHRPEAVCNLDGAKELSMQA